MNGLNELPGLVSPHSYSCDLLVYHPASHCAHMNQGGGQAMDRAAAGAGEAVPCR